jgi:hypothetical protein
MKVRIVFIALQPKKKKELDFCENIKFDNFPMIFFFFCLLEDKIFHISFIYLLSYRI